MTLDFKKLVLNNVKKEMKVQHFTSNCQIFKKDELPVQVQQAVAQVKGESFLEDGDYTLWFSGPGLTKEIVEKTVFKIMNKALGSSANDSSEADLTMIDLKPGANDEVPDGTVDDVASITEPEADDANAQAVGELVGTREPGANPNDSDDDADEMDDLDESVESPAEGEKFVFVKITMK